MAADLEAIAQEIRARRRGRSQPGAGAEGPRRQAPAEPAARGEDAGLVERLFNPQIQRPDPQGGAITFATEAQRQLLSNILNVPAATLELARQGSVAGTSPLGGLPLPPEDVDLRVDPDRVVAGVRTVGRMLGGEGPGEDGLSGAFRRELESLRQERAQRRQENPGAAAGGQVGGDVLTLLGGRLPLARARQAIPALQLNQKVPPGAQREVARFVNSGPVQRLFRGTGRAAETGLEGGLLAVLDRGDPAEVAAASAGLQAGGSLALTAGKKFLERPGLNTLVSIGLGTIGLQMFKELSPGGRDRILESSESAVKKFLAAGGLGMLAGAAGTGRLTGPFAESLPKVADALSAVPRGALTSLVNDLLEEEERGVEQTEVVIDQLAREPDFFGAEARQRLERALRSERRSVSAEINRLMRTRRFRDRFEAARRAPAAAEDLVTEKQRREAILPERQRAESSP